MNLDFIRIIDKSFGHIIALILVLYSKIQQFFSNDTYHKKFGKVKKILIVRFFGFGNLVLAFPSIKEIHELFPDAKIYLLTINKNKHLYDAVDFIDKTIYINVNSFKDFMVSFFTIAFSLRKEKFDLAVDFEIFAYISTFLLYGIGIKKRVGYEIEGYLRGPLYTTPVKYNNNQHISKTFYDLAVALGAEKKESVELIELNVSMRDRVTVKEFLRKNAIDKTDRLVGIHVGSGENFINRRWPETHFAKVADYLVNKFMAKIILTGTKSELSLINNTIQEMKSDTDRVFVADNFNLSQLAFLIKQCKVYLCTDTGPLHLAIAMGVPTVSFFGPNTPSLYGPPPQKKHIYFYENVSCSPCITNYNAKRSKCKKPLCLINISAEKVIASLDLFLKNVFTDNLVIKEQI